MKFYMSDEEIRVSYNTAKNQTSQVQVLAELNATTTSAMTEKLRELGCDVPELPAVRQKPLRAHDVLFDEDRARALFAEGKSDLDISEMLGININAFETWRKKQGMLRQRGGDMRAFRKPGFAQPPMPPDAETPEPEPAPETAGGGSQTAVAEAGRAVSAEAIGVTLLDLAKRYPGLTLTVNGAAVRSLCLNVRVLINGTEDMSSTLDLEVG